MSARDDVLARVRAALRDVPAGEALEAPRLRAAAAAAAATPSRASPSAWRTTAPPCARPTTLAATIAQVCAEHDARRLGVPTGLLEGWRPDGSSSSRTTASSARELDALDGALTGCALAIAETGTIVLDGGERSGRRALTLVPDLHLCLVERSQVVATVPDAIRALERRRAGPSPSSRARAPRATSSSTASRASTARGAWRCCSSSGWPGPGSCARP